MSQQADFLSLETSNATRAVAEALAGADYQHAYELAQAALIQGLIHPTFFSARAIWLERQNRDEEALADFERSISLAPRNAVVLNAIGLCLTRLQRLDEAVSAFDEAIRLSPTYTASYHRKGIALGMTGDVTGARRANEQAIRLNPRDTEALGSLASLAARSGDLKKAAGYAERALKLSPGQLTATAAQALIANAEHRFADAEHLMRPLLERPDLVGHGRASVMGVLADSLDGQDRTAEAFAAYGSENEELRRLHAPRFAGMRSITDLTRELVDYFRSASQEAWKTQENVNESRLPGRPREHVFLLGFYRSGTTLLRQVLASHPEIVALEERDFLLGPAAAYLSDAAGLARLIALSDDELAAERDTYWQKIRDAGVDLGGKVFVDKQPMNTIKLPLIARLFPNARIVFVVRDPRDVVLSCFRRHFEVNAAMFDLLTLEGTAEFYDAVMQFADLMQPLFPEAFIVHKYEDMVADFDRSVSSLCDHLCVPFSSAMRNFHSATNAQDVRSPSAPQVKRELYGEGVEQWRRYQAQLVPVLPILRPWVEKFGYPVD
jgi:Flp pilus assembly protein TadD